MPRLRSRIHQLHGKAQLDLLMALRIGPVRGDGLSEEDLRIGWEIHGQRIMEGRQGRGPGTRPWGWWRFVAGEQQPRERWVSEGLTRGHWEREGAETIRLA